jgi:hypothetical protein
MHCEKNLCENIVKTLMGENDYARGREDMKEMGIREELWLQPSAHNATYVLTPAEKEKVLELISGL